MGFDNTGQRAGDLIGSFNSHGPRRAANLLPFNFYVINVMKMPPTRREVLCSGAKCKQP